MPNLYFPSFWLEMTKRTTGSGHVEYGKALGHEHTYAVAVYT
jgi:hypothetical protein